MKRFNFLFAVIVGLAFSMHAFADDTKTPPAQPQTQKVDESAKLDARLADAMKLTQDRMANLSKEEKEKLLDDLNHPDGKTIGQGMALFGKELGQGLGSAVKEAGTSFNDFANSGVGKIATAIIVWKLFGREVLWFIFILLLLKGLGKAMTKIFGKFDEKGKFVHFDLDILKGMDDGVIFGIFLVSILILGACIIGAAVNF